MLKTALNEAVGRQTGEIEARTQLQAYFSIPVMPKWRNWQTH